MLWTLFMCILIEWLVLAFRLQTVQWRGGSITCLASMCLLTAFFSWLLYSQSKQLHPKGVLCMFLAAKSSNSSWVISTLIERKLVNTLQICKYVQCVWTLLLICWVFVSSCLVLSQAVLWLITFVTKLADKRREYCMVWLNMSGNVIFKNRCLATYTAEPMVWERILCHILHLKIFQVIMRKLKTLTWIYKK